MNDNMERRPGREHIPADPELRAEVLARHPRNEAAQRREYRSAAYGAPETRIVSSSTRRAASGRKPSSKRALLNQSDRNIADATARLRRARAGGDALTASKSALARAKANRP